MPFPKKRVRCAAARSIIARHGRMRRVLAGFALAVAGFSSPENSLADETLLVRARIDGRETGLYEKVVVTSAKATISDTPGGRKEAIEPFAVFFKLRTDQGAKEQGGYIRVGSATGEPLGWIRSNDVTSWNTRFVLEPLQPVPGRTFSLDLGAGLAPATLEIVPGGKRRFALITSSPSEDRGDDTVYPVVVYAGNVQRQGAGGTLARERNRIDDLKLEVVFVIESTDFMLGKYGGDLTLLNHFQRLVRDLVSTLRANDEMKDAIKFGIVEYQDSTEKAEFISRVTCKLTDNSERLFAKLDSVNPIRLEDDNPDDVIAGLYTAVTDAGWSENSSKHVILLGSTNCQLEPRGKGVNPFGGDYNFITHLFERSLDNRLSGGNSTGLSIAQLIAKANAQGGSADERARNAITFHAMLGGKDARPIDKDLSDAIERIVKLNDTGLHKILQFLEEKHGKDRAIDLLVACFSIYSYRQTRDLARSEYRQISHNEAIDGLFLDVPPELEKVQEATARLKTTLNEAFSAVVGVRSGRVGAKELKEKSNEVSQSFYALVGAAAEKFKDEPTLSGTAKVRDERGREVAQRKVLVARDELVRLQSTLDSLYVKFKAKVAKVDRQDVSQILDELKAITAATSTGQAVTADVKLRDLISDLPLRTSALETTPADLAVMPSDTFNQWLNKLETAKFRVVDLLEGKAEWHELSSKAQNDRFTFLRLTELP